MPILMEMRENGRVVLIRVSDPWTIDDMDRFFAQVKPHVDQSSQLVYVLLDMTSARGVPSRLVIRLRNEPMLTHPNYAETAVVNANPVIQALFGVAAAVFHLKPARFLKSEDEAWDYLRAKIAANEP